MGTDANPMAVSQLHRFRPRYAAKAAGTPQQRYQNSVVVQFQSTAKKRRLPKTQQQLEQERRAQRR
jgi:7,8-dihydro-6-hydroxymethylpterin-pyrophosphokinase